MSARVALKFGDGAMLQGIVRFVNSERHFGFITRDDGGADVFVHVSGFADNKDFFLEGARVEFNISTNPKTSKPCAVNVRVVQMSAELHHLSKKGK